MPLTACSDVRVACTERYSQLLLARNRSDETSAIWSRSGEKRTQLGHRRSEAIDPKATLFADCKNRSEQICGGSSTC
jgi:hypothetical protein